MRKCELSILTLLLVVGCHPINSGIFVTNQLTQPIVIEYHAFNGKYFVGIDKEYSRKDKDAGLLYNPLLCNRCEIIHKGDSKVIVILPPKDSVIISGSKTSYHYPGDVLVIGEMKVYSLESDQNYPAGFEILNHLEPFGNNKIISIDSSNFKTISIPDSFNYPCMRINKGILDTNNSYFTDVTFCRLENDSIRFTEYASWIRMRTNVNYRVYHEYYYQMQRDAWVEIFPHEPRKIMVPKRP
jgi:hypothetical protein